MYAQGYLQTQRRHPLGLAAAVAINGGAVAALMLFQPAIGTHVPDIIKIIDIDRVIDEPPPIPLPPPVEHKTVVKRVDRIVEAPPSSGGETLASNTDDAFPIRAGGGEAIVTPPPIHEPVTVKAGWSSRYAGDLQPPYPPAMQRMAIEGAVKVRILVGADGRAKDIVAVSSDNDAFFAATRAWGLRHWRFTPETRDGEPVEAWLTTTVRFRLER